MPDRTCAYCEKSPCECPVEPTPAPSAIDGLTAFIAECRRLDEAASKAPWTWDDQRCEMYAPHACSDPSDPGDQPCEEGWCRKRAIIQTDSGCYGPKAADAALIAFARNALPRVIAIAEELERVRAKLADLNSVRQIELEHVAQSAQEAFEEADERANEYEGWAETLAADLGCEAKWSNLHDHFQCIRSAALSLSSHYKSADATIPALMSERDAATAEAERYREALERFLAQVKSHSVPSDWACVHCHPPGDGAFVCGRHMAEAALTPTPGDGQ